MSSQRHLHPHVREVVALVPSTLAAVLAVILVSGSGAAGPAPAGPASSIGTSVSARAGGDDRPARDARIALHMGDDRATATLEDTGAARRFAAMLPVEVTLHDPMGQAKSGRLPRPLEISGADRVVDPEDAGIYYWPPSGDIAIFHEDLGHRVPPPGMVRLGTVDSGLEAIASAGNRFTVRIETA